MNKIWLTPRHRHACASLLLGGKAATVRARVKIRVMPPGQRIPDHHSSSVQPLPKQDALGLSSSCFVAFIVVVPFGSALGSSQYQTIRNRPPSADPVPGTMTSFASDPRRIRRNIWPGPCPPQDILIPCDSPVPCQPELEDEGLVAWAMAHVQPETSTDAMKVDVLNAHGGKIEWHDDVDDEELTQFISQRENPDSDQPLQCALRVFFIHTANSSSGWLPGNLSLRPKTMRGLQAGGLSGIILAEIYSSEGIWDKMGESCFLRKNNDGALSSFELSYRYQCGWNQGISFTQLIRTRSLRTYFCINYPVRAIARLKQYLHRRPTLACREFFLDVLAADESIRVWQRLIGEHRGKLLELEGLTLDDFNVDTSTITLHYLSRDWHIILQDISDLCSQLQFFQKAYGKYLKNLRNPRNGWLVDTASNTNESFEALESRCNIYRRWILNYKERTNIRINLFFHIASQREFRTNTQIATSTAKVAEQTQRDSASMITIAAVTMIFLPGTFVSAILTTQQQRVKAFIMEDSYDPQYFKATEVPIALDTNAKYGKRLTAVRKYNLLACIAETCYVNADLAEAFNVDIRTIKRYRG
ncbi:hypothetical protein DL765_001413 [Monosporascus sp. GIB2]|nr:hypothetical protein DL765_001413 [Monosporascus sp. GIB2]